MSDPTVFARALVLAILAATLAAGERIPIVISARAAEAERTAAAELASHLAAMYRVDRFEVTAVAPKTGKSILLGTPASLPELLDVVPASKLAEPESFVITSAVRHRVPAGIIAGADESGTVHAVYALLERLGWGFYLSYDAAPPHPGPFGFRAWELADAPLFQDRVIFQWHNFLSSASTWEPEDWQRWIRGAAGMRYNTVMVHAYGNNPMFMFRHNGQAKPVGHLATTVEGRDWGTEHVNDVRRLWGGEVFHSAVFGSKAALASDAGRAAAAQAEVRQAFALARNFGLHVAFALDVDTESANPQNVILTLPESARIRSGKWQLANPDAPEGYAYWKAQVTQLLKIYPQIDRLVVWFRAGATPWRNLKSDEFPAAWKTAYAAALDLHPHLRDDPNAPSMFAMGRIVAAFSRALGELGRDGVQLGAGTWNYAHLPAADAFFPPGVKLYWLDTSTVFDQPATQAAIRSIPPERPMLPVVWAHHDDRTYIGRPYTPYPNFSSLVEGAGTGFGIIHWTTRPLDLYFKSLGEQAWRHTRDRPLAHTARDMAERSFGPSAVETGAEYLVRWATEGRMFGRETSDRFIDVPLADAADVIARARERLARLAHIDENALAPEGRERLRYYRDYEEFVAAFFASHAAYEQALELHQRGETAAARAALSRCDPRRAIELYTQAASHGAITRAEQALVVSLNLRWLPYILSLHQALGLEPAQFKFGPTRHEPLAQGAGTNTFWVDAQRGFWKQLGEKETGVPAVSRPAADEICGSGIRIDRPLTLKVAGIMGDRLSPGPYRVELVAADGSATVEARGSEQAPFQRGDTVEVTGGAVELIIRPDAGAVVACAVRIRPEVK